MNSKAIKHHYIPQFILRGFSNDKEHVLCCDLETGEAQIRKVNQIFFTRNLYKDERLDIPIEIENELAKFESEVAPLFERIRKANKSFSLTIDEEDKLKLFIAILGFRANRTRNYFKKELDDENKDFYSKYLKDDETFEELWKRNLFEISKCRSFQDIKNSNTIDDVFKAFMAKDTIGLTGSYFIVCDKRGNEDFVLSDCFPMVHEGFLDSGISLTLYLFIPLSPKRILIQAFFGCKNSPNSLSLIDKKILVYPSLNKNNFKYSVKKIYEEDIHRINEATIKNSSYGYIKGEN